MSDKLIYMVIRQLQRRLCIDVLVRYPANKTRWYKFGVVEFFCLFTVVGQGHSQLAGDDENSSGRQAQHLHAY
jgi:hypothetical protein